MDGNAKLEQQLVWLMAVVFTAFLISAGITFWANSKVSETERQRGLTHARLETLDSLMLAFTNAETGQRGYLLTGDPSYLQPYYAAVTATTDQLMRFRGSFSTTEGLIAYNKLATLKEKKFSELAQTISLRNEHGLPSAMMVVNSNMGAGYMTEIREHISTLASHETAQLQRLGTAATRYVTILQYSVTLFVLLLALAVLSVVTVVRHDIRARKHFLERLNHEATHDTLTNLPNRNMYIQMLNYSIPLARRSGHFLGILFIDLDGFKQVNDRYGHDAGDLVLKEAANRMRRIARQSDVVARIGGDEFVVLATNMASMDDIERIAQHMLGCFETPLLDHLQEARIGASIGIAIYPSNGQQANALIKAADKAMYEAKQAGKHRYAFYQGRSEPDVAAPRILPKAI